MKSRSDRRFQPILNSFMRALTCIGDATDVATWSGIPHFFLKSAQASGFLDVGWQLHPEKLARQRLLWNAAEVLRTGRYGGFQYTETFLNRLLRQVSEAQRQAEVVSHCQLFPTPEQVEGPISYYIDATLSLLFRDYGLSRSVSPRMRRDALARERRCYQAAARIVCMSRWAAHSVVSDYAVAPTKVHVIPGGANLEDAALARVQVSAKSRPLSPLRLGFVGKDYARKNLALCIDVAEALARQGVAAEVAAAGFSVDQGPSHPLLVKAGFIDKRAEMDRFVEFVSSAHFGCLFSHSEAFGISNREFIRLGVPVLTWDAGGLGDTVPEGLGHVFRAGAAAEEVAEVLAGYAREPERYAALRRRLAERSGEVTWERTVERFQAVWAGSLGDSYAALVGG
jgi:glycosyltransferase involved in cell wall biosynthesis